jgi:tol-pal system protein YbgF
MIKFHRLLLNLCFICLLPLNAWAEAPVVDDSENFAILDEQQAAIEQPVAKAQLENIDPEEEIALAKDNHDNDDNAGLLDKIQSIQQELQELRGQLEVQAHDLKLLQQQQFAFYKDLDVRLRHDPAKTTQSAQTVQSSQPTELLIGPQVATTPNNTIAMPIAIQQEKANQKVATPSSTVNFARINPADEQISYLAAYDLVKNKHFNEALKAMQAFATQYPQSGYTANAHYWLGELYIVKNNYPKAMEHFETVLQQFPSSSKAAASTLKIGYVLAASGKTDDARMRLQQVLKSYPDTPTAQLAIKKLKLLDAHEAS